PDAQFDRLFRARTDFGRVEDEQPIEPAFLLIQRSSKRLHPRQRTIEGTLLLAKRPSARGPNGERAIRRHAPIVGIEQPRVCFWHGAAYGRLDHSAQCPRRPAPGRRLFGATASMDVTAINSEKRAAETVRQERKTTTLYGFVNNAASSSNGARTTIDEAAFREQLDVNLLGPVPSRTADKSFGMMLDL